jgi:hypothetical protein
MRVQFEVDRQGFTLRLKLTGIPKIAEFMNYADAIYTEAGFEKGMRVIIDGRRLAILPRDEELTALGRAFGHLRAAGIVGNTAIILASDQGQLAAHVFKAAAGAGDPVVMAFRTPEAALDWLENPQPATAVSTTNKAIA